MSKLLIPPLTSWFTLSLPETITKLKFIVYDIIVYSYSTLQRNLCDIFARLRDMFVNLVLSRHREVHAYMYVQYVCTHTRCKLQCTCTSYMYFRWGRVVRDHIASGSRPYREWFATISSGSPPYREWFATISRVVRDHIASGSRPYREWFATISRVVRDHIEWFATVSREVTEATRSEHVYIIVHRALCLSVFSHCRLRIEAYRY